MENFALLIKKFREDRGLSQKQLAEKAGIGSGTIGDIERGDRKGKISTLDKISKALNLTKEERDRLDNAFMGRNITSSSIDPRVEILNKKEKNQYEKTMNEAALFFNDENISEEDKQKLLLAMNEMFFMSKQINKEKYAKKSDKDKK
ncbi:helix-turn-helix domain-containing protein [Fusobacterium mortiferum]|uniref:XRE family transcriptional regulator n=1 Tax=Fusobacterium mortiferum ATCC 9817 TaxID=469616 RepID=A0ABN5J9Y7_FUSMR|nr:helix-turn-helix transcriptional regulator [Fusobacterium mortiferum]AVQ19223.1 XRE family transcriptional regulator [Fusobacterium mortiferum ATCC 9817]EEO36375.2 DNA-binding helix-turn-helix protein [Fusobacterium mortiferum ATCC 9817]